MIKTGTNASEANRSHERKELYGRGEKIEIRKRGRRIIKRTLQDDEYTNSFFFLKTEREYQKHENVKRKIKKNLQNSSTLPYGRGENNRTA